MAQTKTDKTEFYNFVVFILHIIISHSQLSIVFVNLLLLLLEKNPTDISYHNQKVILPTPFILEDRTYSGD